MNKNYVIEKKILVYNSIETFFVLFCKDINNNKKKNNNIFVCLFIFLMNYRYWVEIFLAPKIHHGACILLVFRSVTNQRKSIELDEIVRNKWNSCVGWKSTSTDERSDGETARWQCEHSGLVDRLALFEKAHSRMSTTWAIVVWLFVPDTDRDDESRRACECSWS